MSPKTPLPPGSMWMPSLVRISGGDVGDGPAVVAHHARAGVPSPAITRRIVDLPAPLVPSSASTSPLRTSKPTSKRICTWP